MLNLLIFIVQLYLFSFVAIILHYNSPRIGLAPLLFMLAGIIGLLNVIELNLLTITLPSNVILRPGGHIFIPVTLLIILMLYVVHGTRQAQIAVVGIIGVNVLVFFTLLFTLIYVRFASENAVVTGYFTDANVFNLIFVRGMVASLFAFVADMLLLIIVYQGINNHVNVIPRWMAPGIALIVALWADTVIYNVGAFGGTQIFSVNVANDILLKTLMGLLLLPMIGIYLTRFATKLPEFLGPENRRTLGILFLSNYYNSKRVETLESELRISRSVYNQLTQHIEEIFWLIDIEEKRFVYVSPAYERITKYSVEPLYQNLNHLLTIIYEEDRNLTQDDILHFLTSTRHTEFRIVCPDKSLRTLRARAFPITDEQGQIIRYAGVAEDITEHKKLTAQEFELALTRERVQILHNFIRDASHDLKTPISAMILKLSMLDRIEDDERRRELRHELRERAMFLSNLINDLFTLSRIEGQDLIEMTRIELNAIVQGAIKDTEPLADEKHLLMIVQLAPETLYFQGNAEQINRVVSNLISNAIRYTQNGTVAIQSWASEEKVYLSVRDTGIGIPKANHQRIFERFFRSVGARDTQDGTGLGLAIAKAVADRHHGRIEVESEPGKGSTFTLILPQTQPDALANVTAIGQVDVRRTTQEMRTLPDV
ncbi:MAG: ATP-binding protein [Anaerolineae bacterium]